MQEQTAQAYEYGRSDGVADGAQDYDWNQARIEARWTGLREEIQYGGKGREGRAYTLGYARGYREATWPGVPDGGGLLHPVAELPR